MSRTEKLTIVLIEPEIPWNTGNIARTCLAANAELILIGRPGFFLDDKAIRRAGMDYWSQVPLTRHKTWDEFKEGKEPSQFFFFSPSAQANLWNANLSKGGYLIFGRESSGLPTDLLAAYPNRVYKIPMSDEARSLNLSTTVGISLFEAIRQIKQSHNDGNIP